MGAEEANKAVSNVNFALRQRPGADYSHLALSYVSPLYFNQCATRPVSEILDHYARYAPAILDRVQFVFVDDCSPVRVTVPTGLNLNILLLRIREDIPWNQAGARNLGVTYARSDKVLLTDIDHEVPEVTFAKLISMSSPGRRTYKLKRRNPDGTALKPAPNILFLSRNRFLELYGYDEEFCGAYGFEDLWLLRWQRYHGSRICHLPERYFVQVRTVDRTRAYHSLARDFSRNADLYSQKRTACETLGPHAGHTRQFLRFTWDVILDRQRSTPSPAHVPPPLWQLTWRWNKLLAGRH
jgi:hypothetical protein